MQRATCGISRRQTLPKAVGEKCPNSTVAPSEGGGGGLALYSSFGATFECLEAACIERNTTACAKDHVAFLLNEPFLQLKCQQIRISGANWMIWKWSAAGSLSGQVPSPRGAINHDQSVSRSCATRGGVDGPRLERARSRGKTFCAGWLLWLIVWLCEPTRNAGAPAHVLLIANRRISVRRVGPLYISQLLQYHAM